MRCTGIECPAKLFRNLVHFVSREAMNIDGLGENIIQQLLDKQLIHNISDIYELEFEDIASLKKNGKKCQVQQAERKLEGAYHYTNPELIPEGTQCILVLGI